MSLMYNVFKVFLMDRESRRILNIALDSKLVEDDVMNELVTDYHSAKLTIKRRTELLAESHAECANRIAEAGVKCYPDDNFIEFAKAVDELTRFQAEYVEALLDILGVADDTIKKMLEASIWRLE